MGCTTSSSKKVQVNPCRPVLEAPSAPPRSLATRICDAATRIESERVASEAAAREADRQRVEQIAWIVRCFVEEALNQGKIRLSHMWTKSERFDIIRGRCVCHGLQKRDCRHRSPSPALFELALRRVEHILQTEDVTLSWELRTQNVRAGVDGMTVFVSVSQLSLAATNKCGRIQ